MPATPSRRSLVTAALVVPAAAASGCTLSGPSPQRTSAGRRAEVDPDVALLSEVAAATDAIVELYKRMLDEHRGLRGELRAFLATHRAHAKTLGAAAPTDERGAGGTADGQSNKQSGGRSGRGSEQVEVPAQRDKAVREVRAAERDLEAQLMDATLRAVSGDFARLLASMSAASAQNVHLLAGVGGR